MSPDSDRGSITVRPAQADDFPQIADLLIQLYAVELPGALQASHAAQHQLLLFTLSAKGNQGLNGRYVACTSSGTVVASVVVERPGNTPYERAPDGTIAMAVRALGYRGTLQLLRVVAKSLIGVKAPQLPKAVAFHSIVVDEAYRGQGVGRALMAELEQLAAMDGYQTVWLQVLQMNRPAHDLYRRLGYEEFWATPRWARLLTWPSYMMRKPLLARA